MFLTFWVSLRPFGLGRVSKCNTTSKRVNCVYLTESGVVWYNSFCLKALQSLSGCIRRKKTKNPYPYIEKPPDFSIHHTHKLSLSLLFFKLHRHSRETKRKLGKKERAERGEKRREMRSFLTAFISSIAITTATLSIPLHYHNRNRTSQALLLRQQTQLLTTLFVQPSIAQRLRSEAEQSNLECKEANSNSSSSWTTERCKSLWNDEVIGHAVRFVTG